MRQPCAKECPMRTSTCRIECEKYKEYRKFKDEEYRQRKAENMIRDAEFTMREHRRRSR